LASRFEERAEFLRRQLDDARRAALPQFGDQQVALFGVEFDFKGEHCYRGISEIAMKLQGIFPPITTPFDHSGNIYAAKVQHNVEKWHGPALSGYVVMGSTGERVMLTPDEKFTMWELVAKHAAPEKLLIAGTGMESVRETVCLTNRAAEMGYKAAMVRT